MHSDLACSSSGVSDTGTPMPLPLYLFASLVLASLCVYATPLYIQNTKPVCMEAPISVQSHGCLLNTQVLYGGASPPELSTWLRIVR